MFAKMFNNVKTKVNSTYLKNEVEYFEIYVLLYIFLITGLTAFISVKFLLDGQNMQGGLSLASLLLTVVGPFYSIYEINEYYEIVRYRVTEFLHELFNVESPLKHIDFDYYIKCLERGDFYRKLFIGVSDAEQGFLTRNTLQEPGFLVIGMMGSGKTSMAVAVTVTSQCSSSDSVFQLIIDPSSKGGADFSFLEGFDNVAFAGFNTQKLFPAISFLDAEMKARSKRFMEIGDYPLEGVSKTSNYEEYEAMHAMIVEDYRKLYSKIETNQTLSKDELERLRCIAEKDILYTNVRFNRALLKIVSGERSPELIEDCRYTRKEPLKVAIMQVIMDEYHSIPVAPEVSWYDNVSTPGSLANILSVMYKVSRSLGFTFGFITQKARGHEFPQETRTATALVACCKVASDADASAVDLPHATEIKSIVHKGRCAYEDGFIQPPLIKKHTARKLCEKYTKPFTGAMFAYQPQEYRDALSGEGSDGMCMVMELGKVIPNWTMFNPKTIVRRILGLYGLEEIERPLDSLEISMVMKKGDEIYSVLILDKSERYSSSSRRDTKNFISESKEIIKADKMIIIDPNGGDDSINGNTLKIGKELTKLAEVFDNRSVTEVSGYFDTLYKSLKLTQFIEGSVEEAEESSPRGRRSGLGMRDDFDSFLDDM